MRVSHSATFPSDHVLQHDQDGSVGAAMVSHSEMVSHMRMRALFDRPCSRSKVRVSRSAVTRAITHTNTVNCLDQGFPKNSTFSRLNCL